MKIGIVIFAAWVVMVWSFAFSPLAQGAAPRQSPAWQGLVCGVLDGDTLDVMRIADGAMLRVRLADIDAPEKDQPGGTEAARHLKNIALWRIVAVQEAGRDKYKRTIAVVTRKGGCYTYKRGDRAGQTVQRRDWSLNGNMVWSGHAWTYPGTLSRGLRWRIAEVDAIRHSRGLWKEKIVIAPWEWRNRKKT